MPIRRRIKQKFPKLPYHKKYGPWENPPLYDGMYWPNGALTTSQNVPGRMGRSIVIGWTSHRGLVTGKLSDPIGVWVCTQFKSTLAKVNQTKDFKYVGEASGHLDAAEMLREAYEELHDTVLG